MVYNAAQFYAAAQHHLNPATSLGAMASHPHAAAVAAQAAVAAAGFQAAAQAYSPMGNGLVQMSMFPTNYGTSSNGKFVP